MVLVAAAAAGESVFVFLDDRITESSGLVVSPTQDVVWTVNDSGADARVHAVDMDGCTRLDLVLEGVTVRDVEDLAIDRSTSPPGLVVADVGDNTGRRPDVAVHVVFEPAVDIDGPCPAVAPELVVTPTSRRLVLEDGATDIESVVVDPMTSEVLMATKGRDGPPRVLVADGDTLRTLATLELGDGDVQLTGGAAAPDGSAIVFRSYARAWTFPRVHDLATTFAAVPPPVDLPLQPQGEAIAWHTDGTWWLSSEDPLGTRPPVLRVGVAETHTEDASPSAEASDSPSVEATPSVADDGREDPVLAPGGEFRLRPIPLAITVVVGSALLFALVAVLVVRRDR